MPDLRLAATQALEALEDHAKQYPHMQKGYTVDAITALRTALAEPDHFPDAGKMVPEGYKLVPVKPTEAMMRAAYMALESEGLATTPWMRGVCYGAMLAAAPEAPQPKAEQEPVAWQWLNTAHYRKKLPPNANKAEWVPLYATPQPRRRLTDEELGKIINANWGVGVWQMGRAIEDAIFGDSK